MQREKGPLSAMANYFLHVKIFARGKGSKATKAAAYRAGERIRDERTSAVYNYTSRTDVAHAEIVLPTEYADQADMEWALDRSTLWNAAEHAGRQWNSRLAREILVHVPPELTAAQRTHLVRGFSRELADRYRNAVDFAIHVPRPQADHRHHHAHLLMTTREVGPGGLGARTTLDLSGTERHARGLGPSLHELLWMRERWAVVTNEALREAGVAARVDHRSYKDQGIDREPQPVIPRAIRYSERWSGRSSPAGDDIRARHRERVEARLKGGEELARVVQRQKAEGRQRALQSAERKALHKKTPQGALTREQLNEKRREYCKANAQEIARKQRERRRANADEVNRKQREYYRKRLTQQKTASSSPNAQEQQPVEAKTGASASVERKAVSIGHASSTPSAEESVKNWLAFRESQKQLPAKGSLSNWLAYRESQTQAAPPKSPSQDRSREPGAAGTDNRDGPAAEKNSKRDRKNDAGL
jgi:hypothetical protein